MKAVGVAAEVEEEGIGAGEEAVAEEDEVVVSTMVKLMKILKIIKKSRKEKCL